MLTKYIHLKLCVCVWCCEGRWGCGGIAPSSIAWMGVSGHLDSLITLPSGTELLSDFCYYGEDLNLLTSGNWSMIPHPSSPCHSQCTNCAVEVPILHWSVKTLGCFSERSVYCNVLTKNGSNMIIFLYEVDHRSNKVVACKDKNFEVVVVVTREKCKFCR